MGDSIQQAAKIIANSRKIAVLTGAGVSKESGVPTFRDAMTGLWVKFKAEDLATRAAFARNPKLVWDWYTFRREMVREAQPNPGHVALAQLEALVPELTLITQNVDDLHERAGSEHVIHLHGNIAQSKCYNDCQGSPTVIDLAQLDYDPDDGPPACPHCGAWVRPDVVWFGEMLPGQAIEAAYHACESADVMLVVGTSGIVTPAATLPSIAKEAGATVIEVNPDWTPITAIADVKLDGPSGAMLPRLVAAFPAE